MNSNKLNPTKVFNIFFIYKSIFFMYALQPLLSRAAVSPPPPRVVCTALFMQAVCPFVVPFEQGDEEREHFVGVVVVHRVCFFDPSPPDILLDCTPRKPPLTKTPLWIFGGLFIYIYIYKYLFLISSRLWNQKKNDKQTTKTPIFLPFQNYSYTLLLFFFCFLCRTGLKRSATWDVVAKKVWGGGPSWR